MVSKYTHFPEVDWSIIDDLNLDFDLNDDDFQFSMPMGIEMVNDVITKPFSVKIPAYKRNYHSARKRAI